MFENLTPQEQADTVWPMTDTLRMEAVMCLWEAVLDGDLFPEYRDDNGAVALRHTVMTLADPLHLGWTLVNKDLMCPFDWEYVPWFLTNCVDARDGTLFPNWMEICRATR